MQINRIKKSLGILVFFLGTVSVFSQQDLTFQAFGHTPQTIPDSLYQQLYNASSTAAKTRLLYHIGKEHQKYGDGDSIIYYAKQLSFQQALNSPNILLKTKLLLGEGNLLKGFINDAQGAFLEGLSTSNSTKQTAIKKWLELGLAKTYMAEANFIKSKELLNRFKLEENDTLASKSLYLLAAIALREKAFEKSRTYLDKASLRIAPLELTRPKMEIQLLLAHLYYAKGEEENALDSYNYLINNALNEHFYDIYTESVLAYGSIYRENGAYGASEMTLSMAYANAMNWNRAALQKRIIKSLIKTYTAKGDYKNAYALMTQFEAISNDILRKENRATVKELEVKYNTLEKENQIYRLKETQQAKENEISRQKTIKMAFLYGFLALLLPIIALLYVYYQKLQAQSALHDKQEQLNAQKIASLLNQQELDLVQTSFDSQQQERTRIAKQLHDSIGGNLAGIKLQLGQTKAQSARTKLLLQQVDETYELVREISHDLTPKKFQQNSFTLLLQQYLAQIANNATIEISFSVHPEDAINSLAENLKVEVYRILQELLTNCLKHANATTIEVLLNLIEDQLQLIYEDNGQGFDPKTTVQGIGLKNLKNRTEYLQGSLHIDSSPKRGTAITIEIPMKSKEL